MYTQGGCDTATQLVDSGCARRRPKVRLIGSRGLCIRVLELAVSDQARKH
jgi:hypothetical protein